MGEEWPPQPQADPFGTDWSKVLRSPPAGCEHSPELECLVCWQAKREAT
jgi:hypothetical protein